MERGVKKENSNSSEVNEILKEFMDECILPKVCQVFAEILEEDRQIYHQKLDEFQQQVDQLQKKLAETQAELAKVNQPSTITQNIQFSTHKTFSPKKEK